MLIECKYYDVAAKEMEELDKQIAEESENLSEGELQLENDRRDFQLAEIIRSFKEKEKMKEKMCIRDRNAVEYFVSYYDYYQPEAYVPSSDTYIAKAFSVPKPL